MMARSKLATDFHTIYSICLQLIQSRRQAMEPSMVTLVYRQTCINVLKNKDFLQLLMEARADDNDELPSSSSKTLADKEIVSICADFLLAGYETTSNCLAYTSYLLALNTDIQDKLCQMIEDYYQENPVSILNCTIYVCTIGCYFI